jgi:hypothetical protein
VNRPALVVGAVLLVALAAVTAVGEYVRWNLPRGDEKLTACRAAIEGGAVTAGLFANEAGDRSCFFHATSTRDRTKTYRASVMHEGRADV